VIGLISFFNFSYLPSGVCQKKQQIFPFQNRKKVFKNVIDFNVDWIDDPKQPLERDVIQKAVLLIDETISRGK